MPDILRYYAHPNQRLSHVNSAMDRAAKTVNGMTHVDLYAEYPRYNVNPAREQERLLAHDVILFQFPVFWYSAPSLVKEWIDLVLEHGFAFGSGGDKLKGKAMMLAVTAAGPDSAYSPKGYQNYPLRTFLAPFEQTARLCGMRFLAPYVLYSALTADVKAHAQGFVHLLEGLRDDRLDMARVEAADVLTSTNLPLKEEANS